MRILQNILILTNKWYVQDKAVIIIILNSPFGSFWKKIASFFFTNLIGNYR